VHSDRLDLRRERSRREDHSHSRFHDLGLDPTNKDGTDTVDLVDVLEGEAQRFVERTLLRDESVKNFEKRVTASPGDVC
jgi:hypothetical protein